MNIVEEVNTVKRSLSLEDMRTGDLFRLPTMPKSYGICMLVTREVPPRRRTSAFRRQPFGEYFIPSDRELEREMRPPLSVVVSLSSNRVVNFRRPMKSASTLDLPVVRVVITSPLAVREE